MEAVAVERGKANGVVQAQEGFSPTIRKVLGFLPRLEKARLLVEEGKVHEVVGAPHLFVVDSQEGRGRYLVDLKEGTCTCPAFVQGKTVPCKHILAATLFIWGKGKN